MKDAAKQTSYLVMSALGRDRPGIVDEVSDFLFKRGCNIEDSKMAVLGGEFAMILLVSGRTQDVRRMRKDLPRLKKSSGLSITTRLTRPPGPHIGARYITYRLEATSLDHPGIVQRISHLLHRHGINVEAADTRIYNAPVSGAPMFHLDMRIEVPDSVKLATLRQELSELSGHDNIDVEIHPIVT